jgi:hypothetical protein
MNREQISNLIEKNKVNCLQLKDYSGNVLTRIMAKSPQQAVSELEEILPDFSDYRKLEIMGKKGDENTPWSKSFTWYFEFEGAKSQKIGGVPIPAPGQTIGVMDFINMHTTMMDKNMDMLRENLKISSEAREKEIAYKNKDPKEWIPLIRELAPILGLNTSIQGPPQTAEKKELHFGDVDMSTMTEEQIQEAIAMRMISISKKVKPSQFFNVIVALNENPNLKDQIDGLAIMLEAIAKNPALYDMAKSYIK